ncbi:hypothetical protein LWI29_004404 [Acer saccharum]|uniref:Alcohol dehydrogenase-like N-terminal domain-containing protein n=1 Tax=Acer saccharum TaxID=4024 RepID=A0AA39W6J4_ACESA|nr:hypothetical protein LWI29_004404 [Acer saccharum]
MGMEFDICDLKYCRATGEKDVRFKVFYCGICQSDLHLLKNEFEHEWPSSYPLFPRHEIVGAVTEVGSKVEKFQVGDKVGVGCVVGSCHTCNNYANNLENYYNKMILTYGAKYYDGTNTYGGYSDIMVADEQFVVSIPDNLPLDGDAPLLYAGITVYSPCLAAMDTLDGIIDTVYASHPLLPLIRLLKTNGKLVIVGVLEKPLELPVFPLLMGEHTILLS